MMRLLFLLLPLLTDHAALAELLHCGFTFATANAGLLCFLGAFEALRRVKRNRNAAHH
jgi:hypothetical protein